MYSHALHRELGFHQTIATAPGMHSGFSILPYFFKKKHDVCGPLNGSLDPLIHHHVQVENPSPKGTQVLT
jgi:hypothetical protein